jgi:ABC-type phosphate/phosphonate transport system substrate-binding protein
VLVVPTGPVKAESDTVAQLVQLLGFGVVEVLFRDHVVESSQLIAHSPALILMDVPAEVRQQLVEPLTDLRSDSP